MAALKNKGMYLVDPDSANAYNIGGAIAIAAPFVLPQVSADFKILQLGFPAVRVRTASRRLSGGCSPAR